MLLGGLALVLIYSAYVAEVFRAGIESVHPSQLAAAKSLGLNYRRTMRLVVLPQATRRVTPALLNDFVALQKQYEISTKATEDGIENRSKPSIVYPMNAIADPSWATSGICALAPVPSRRRRFPPAPSTLREAERPAVAIRCKEDALTIRQPGRGHAAASR